MLIPVTINYVSAAHYGIWLTLSSIITWFTFFDIGLGNGLKNKLAEALANNDDLMVKTYVSTTYIAMCCISLTLYGIFTFTNIFLDWSKILNAPPSLATELKLVASVVFSVFAVQFVLQLINIICEATQNSRLAALCGFLGNFLSLVIILILTNNTEGSLLYLCFAVGISPLITLSAFSLVLFKKKFKQFRPSFKFASFKSAKFIMRLGFKFFIIQLGLILFYNSNNIIIAQVFGPEAVTPYNIAFKYFGVLTMIAGIIMVPFWSAFTDANARGDFDWIRNTVRRLEKTCILLAVTGLLMLSVSSFIFKFWVGEDVLVPFTLSATLVLYTIINAFRTIYCFYLNGVGKIQLQLYLVLIAGITNVPFAYYLGTLLGPTGVILATTIICTVCGAIEIIQYKKVINSRAHGIWNK